MTPDEIDNLQAGPETDALVAEKVMGWKRFTPTAVYMSETTAAPNTYLREAWLLDETRGACSITGLPESGWRWIDEWIPSTEISAAMEVLGKLSSRRELPFYWWNLGERTAVGESKDGVIPLCVVVQCEIYPHGEDMPFKASAPPREAALAICKAALKAVEAEGP